MILRRNYIKDLILPTFPTTILRHFFTLSFCQINTTKTIYMSVWVGFSQIICEPQKEFFRPVQYWTETSKLFLQPVQYWTSKKNHLDVKSC